MDIWLEEVYYILLSASSRVILLFFFFFYQSEATMVIRDFIAIGHFTCFVNECAA